LNITVSSASVYELPRLLNYLTAPNVLIWSAIAASCSVPFIFSSSEILAKDPQTGQPQSWNATPQRWIDGSVDNDLPMAKLSELFNVNHFIVSQVNPHIVPFLEKGTNVDSKTVHGFGKAGTQEAAIKSNRGLKDKALDLAVGEIMHRMHMMSELGIFPVLCTKVQVLVRRDVLICVSLCSPNDIVVISPSFPTSPTLTILP
jgi:TAG lipase / steryl ester hydrolase / phospholipase A2 / LPA acyltransferase